jgi:LuxR family maltose regulon positive regulatory protein
MSSPILVTKLFIPAARPEIVPRPRLLERLDGGRHRKLTLISAPAGFGKTTVVMEWLNTLRGNSQPEDPTKNRIAWLSLDEDDNDPARFLTYFIAALNQIEEIDVTFGEGSLMMLQSPQPPPIEAVLTPLINEITTIQDRIIFVLDDYHLIDTQPTQDILSFLLKNKPPHLHLVITTREDPLLPLPRLRARGHLTELRAADLRFTSVEAAEFLIQVMGLSISEEDITALETRTEGWIAGLQLAALSLQGQANTSKLIQSFTGSNRLVLDYLVDEVLNQQPQNIQDFLLQTAILDRLTASLCDAVRFDAEDETADGKENGQMILERLERANLFIVPLDSERCWYRYHHLFADLLWQRLKVTHPELINDLHAKAVVWYETNGFLSQAIQHALAGKDINTAIRLIEKGSLDALEKSDFGFILNAVERIPESALGSAPWLFIYQSWALFLTGHIDLADPNLENTDWLLDSLSNDDESQKQEMRGYIAGLKVQLTAWQRDYENMILYANQAKAYLPDHHWIRGYCAMMIGTGFWDTGNLTAAIDAFRDAATVGTVSGNKRVAVTSAVYLGHALELEGHLQQAVSVYQNAFKFAEQDGRELPVACYLHIDFARVLYELNELDLAYQHLTEGIKQSQLLADDRIEKIGHSLLTRVYLAAGDFAQAVNSIHNAEQIIPSPEIIYDMRGGEYPHVRLWLKQKKVKEIDGWLNESGIMVGSTADFKIKVTYTMHARAMIALARAYPDGSQYLNHAHDLLAEFLEMTETNGWGYKVIEILVLQALAYDADGNTTQAITLLERALNQAELEGYIRIFVDEGPSMARLLYEALSRGIAPDSVQQLLAAFPDLDSEQATSSQIQTSESEWIESLSERELDVLQLIAEGLTNQEIASKLYLSLNTVKAHTRNIYSKLGVKSRTKAVVRGKALGVLTTN